MTSDAIMRAASALETTNQKFLHGLVQAFSI